jgi:hypothetical protein
MYKIQIQDGRRIPLAYFNDYEIATKCHIELVKKYPNSIVELEKIQTISCFNEFKDLGKLNISHYNK